MIWTQVGIALCGVTAIFLSQDVRAERRRWSSVFGLSGQPFWFIETYNHQQWIVLGLCTLYTWSWARGFWNYWVVPFMRRHDVIRMTANEAYPACSGVRCARCGDYSLSWSHAMPKPISGPCRGEVRE